MIIIATHSGSHHADDVFGVATLLMIHSDTKVVRTRKPEVIAAADFAVDVGDVWDPARGRYDHHQKSFGGMRDDGVKYASAGLVWREHGHAVVRSRAKALGVELPDDSVHDIFSMVDSSLMTYLDQVDNGVANLAPGAYGLSSIIGMFNVGWMNDELIEANVTTDEVAEAAKENIRYERFMEAVGIATRVITLLVDEGIARHEGNKRVRKAKTIEEGRILVLEDRAYPWFNVVHNEMPDVLFVVYPVSSGEKQYQVKTVPAEPGSFANRKPLPSTWAGLRNADLAAVSGVPDSVFCHVNRFIAGAESLEGAIALAKKALED